MLYLQLTDAHLYIGMHALMPVLVCVDMFIKLCQSRELYIGELAGALKRLTDRLCEMYLNSATNYKTVEFAKYKELIPLNGNIGGTCWEYEGDGEEELIGLVCGGQFHLFTATPTCSGRGGRVSARSSALSVGLTPSLLTDVIASVEASVSEAVKVLVGELHARFPPKPLLDALSIVYSEYWEAKPLMADFQVKLKIVKDHYCNEREGADSSKVPPLLDSGLLDTQAAAFIRAMSVLAAEFRLKRMRERTQKERQAAAEPEQGKRAFRSLLDDTPTLQTWERISNTPELGGHLTEYMALAQLVFVMVPGSVEDERRFSAMAYLQDPTRNRLDEHLALCVRMFTQDLFDLHTFPFEEALSKWLANRSRGRYMMNR